MSRHDHSHDHSPEHEHHHEPEHEHPHDHPGGLRAFLHHLVVPHTHDAADAVDDAMEASADGVRALKVSLVVLLVTTLLQAAVVAVS